MRRKKQSKADKQPEQGLDKSLQGVLDDVGPENYGLATARHFARGGRYARKARPRFAKM